MLTDYTLLASPLPAVSARTRAHLLLLTVLGLSSAFSVALFFGRAAVSHSLLFFFLNWNLFLAWVPVGVALFMLWLDSRGDHGLWLQPFLLLAWLLFLPNAPYLVTDLIHLAPRQNIPVWYDAVFLFSYGWNGLLLGFVALRLVQQIVAKRFGPLIGWILVMGATAASAFGVYLGRFLRWNSWDVVAEPTNLLYDIADRLVNPLEYPQTIAVTILFAGLLAVGYVTTLLLPRAMAALFAATHRQ